VLRDTRTTWARCRIVLKDLARAWASAQNAHGAGNQNQQELENSFFAELGISGDSQEVDALIGSLTLLASSPTLANMSSSACRSAPPLCSTPPTRKQLLSSLPSNGQNSEMCASLRPQKSPRAPSPSQLLQCKDRKRSTSHHPEAFFGRWNRQPSVGTWFHLTHGVASRPPSSTSASSWCLQPSVGSWLRSPAPCPAVEGMDESLESAAEQQTYALFLAARDGDAIAVSQLITANADPCALDERGISALHLAAGSDGTGVLDVVAQLLAGQASPGAATIDGVTPLHVAACFGATCVVKQLLLASAEAKETE